MSIYETFNIRQEVVMIETLTELHFIHTKINKNKSISKLIQEEILIIQLFKYLQGAYCYRN
jgi:hypothetical protein